MHFGVGNFHRAHQAVYLDDLFNAGIGHDWALVGAGVFDGEKAGRDKLQGAGLADHRGRAGRRPHERPRHRRDDRFPDARRCRRDHRTAGRPGDPHRLADHHRRRLFHRPGLRRVQPDASRHRRRRRKPGDAPKTVFGLILAGLVRRRDEGIVPFTVMSCDNIPHNGHVTVGCRHRPGPADRRGSRRLGQRAMSPFPNAMVDRITPATTDREREHPGRGFRHRGQLAGVLRAVPAVGAGGQVHRRPPAAGKGRRAVRRRCRALRADEDPHPQRRPCDHRLSGRADGHPFRP